MSDTETDRYRTEQLCEDTVSGRHSPLDAYGRCSWCGRKVEAKMQIPLTPGVRNDLDEAYELYYDPDYGRP